MIPQKIGEKVLPHGLRSNGDIYLIHERLGRGGMSAVYKVRSETTGKILALKILLPRDEIYTELVGKDRLREIFLEEAYIMRAIRHEHVAEIIEWDDEGETPYIVLEYYPHSDWDEFLLKTIAPDASTRFQSAADMRVHLDSLPIQ